MLLMGFPSHLAQRRRIASANVGIITSTYDALNRLSVMTESGRPTGYGYDLNGNIVTKTLPNGDQETMTFDALNRDTIQVGTSLMYPGPAASNTLFTYNTSYDLAGNVTSINETYPNASLNRTVANTYDGIYRLMKEVATGATTTTTTCYTYDNANNRASQSVTTNGSNVTTTYTYNDLLNQLTSYTDTTRTVNLSYDPDGNRTLRVVSGSPTSSDNGIDSYTYDAENRLVSVNKGTGTLAAGQGIYNYAYDYRTRRILRDESQVSDSKTTTQVIFSGGTSVQEYDTPNTPPTVEYIRGSDYGGGVGGILYTLRGGNPSYTHENKRGDVIAKTSDTGSLTYQAQYQAFGAQVATTGNTPDRQKANSKDYDNWGATNEGMRYRELETGTFLTRDPAGMIDGPNEYCYVRQNPWTKFDPEGLDSRTIPTVDENGNAGSVSFSDTNQHLVPYKVVRDSGFTDPQAVKSFDIDEHNKDGSLNPDSSKLDTPNGHDYSRHGYYTKEVQAELDAFKKERTITDIGSLSAADQQQLARDFINRIKTTDNEFIKGFNSRVADGPLGIQKWFALDDTQKMKLLSKNGATVAESGGEKLLKSEARKALKSAVSKIPIIGAVLGAAITYGMDKAEGASDQELGIDEIQSATGADIANAALENNPITNYGTAAVHTTANDINSVNDAIDSGDSSHLLDDYNKNHKQFVDAANNH